MKKYTTYLLLAGCVLLAAACYDDQSTLPTTDIPRVGIEVPEAIAEELSVVHNTQLDVEGIRITKDGRENPEELTYEWTVSRTENESEVVTLARTREFHEVITLPISSGGYWFVLTVTDPEYGLQYHYRWTLYVTARYGEGLVVAYTRDGETSDLGLIMHPQLTEKYSGPGEGTVNQDLIRERNGSPFPAPVTRLLYTFMPATYQNLLWVATEDDLMRVETDYYEILGRKDDVFVYAPEGIDVRNLCNTYQCTLVLNGENIYETLRSYDRISAPAEGSEGMRVDNDVIAAHAASTSNRKPSTIFYDRNAAAFCYGYNKVFKACGDDPSGPFNPGKAPSLHSIAGGISVDNATLTLLMREDAGAYKLYTFVNGTIPKAGLVYMLPAEASPVLAEAVSVFFSRYEPIVYIATADAIYKAIFTTGAVEFDPKPVYEAPAGERITLARLYVQGFYAAYSYDGSATWPSHATLPWSSRAVVVVTSKGDRNDKLHVVPQTDFGSGRLDATKELVFDGFGEILDVVPAGLSHS